MHLKSALHLIAIRANNNSMSLLYLLLVFVILLTCAALPTSLAALLADSTLLNSYAAVKPALGLGYIEYAKLIWFLRLAVALFTWASGAYILWAARSKPAARRRIMSISAALLFLMPLPFALTSQPGITRLAEPWALILSALFGLFSTLGLVLFAVYYYLFPDGSFSPGWLRWPVIEVLFRLSMHQGAARSLKPCEMSHLLIHRSI